MYETNHAGSRHVKHEYNHCTEFPPSRLVGALVSKSSGRRVEERSSEGLILLLASIVGRAGTNVLPFRRPRLQGAVSGSEG